LAEVLPKDVTVFKFVMQVLQMNTFCADCLDERKPAFSPKSLPF
jgi:hypothetical protein